MGAIIDATNIFLSKGKEKKLGENISIKELEQYDKELYDLLNFYEYDTIYEVLISNPKDLRKINEFTEEHYGKLLYFLDKAGFNTDNLIYNCPYNFATVMNVYIRLKS